jgi:hypothetical protein
MTHPFDGAPIIHRYTRAQALADGALIDLSAEGREAGIRYPVAVTAAAYQEAIDMTAAASRTGCDERGRRWDLVWMLRCAMERCAAGADRIQFTVLVVQDRVEPTPVKLRAVCGPGDDAAPVITVMLPDED